MNTTRESQETMVQTPVAGEYEVRVVCTEEGFKGLEPVWNELLRESDVSVFQTFEWQSTWWKYFGRERRLHCLVFMRDGRPVGIAPMFVEQVRIIGIRVATWLRFMGYGISDYLDLIVSRGHEEAVFAALAEYLQEHAREWDIFEIMDVSERSPLRKHLPSLLGRGKMGVYTYQGNVCPNIALPGSWDEFLQHIGPKMRYELKKKKERLNERYRSEVEIFKSPSDDIDLAVNEFINLHERRWRSLGFRSAFDDEHHRDFHFEVAKKLARRGWLRLFFLKVDGRRVAVSFDFNYNKRIHVYLSHAHGPDEIMKRSPGFLIRCIAIERGIAEGMQVYDLLRGNESYKYEELKCTRSENWLIRGVSPSRTSRARFRVFLVREFTLKCLDRLGREYHEFKRFFITKRPSAIAALRYISAQSLLLGGLGRKYVERFFMNNHTAGTSYDDSSK